MNFYNLHQSFKKNKNSEIVFKLVSGTGWSFFGAIFSRIAMLIASIIIARYIGKQEFGEYSILKSTINTFVVFAGFGLGLTATKYISEFKITDKGKAENIISLTIISALFFGLLFTGFLFFFSRFIAESIMKAPQIEFDLKLGAIALLFSALDGAQNGILAGFEAFKEIAKKAVFSTIISFPIFIILTYYFSLTGAIIGFGMNFFVSYLVGIYFVRNQIVLHKMKLSFRSSLNEISVIRKFTIPALLSGILVSPVMWICNLIVLNSPNGFYELANFDVANQWRNSILFIPLIVSQIALPLFSNSSNNKPKFKKILHINLWISFTSTLLLVVLLILLSPFILESYGDDFSNAKMTFIIMITSGIFVATNQVIGQAIAGKNRMWLGFILNLIWAIILISSLLIFVSLGYASVGLAIAHLLSYIFHTIIQYFVFFRKISFSDE